MSDGSIDRREFNRLVAGTLAGVFAGTLLPGCGDSKPPYGNHPTPQTPAQPASAPATGGEWVFNPRPYTDDEAKQLLAAVMSPETSDWHYNKHHKGYVAALNHIEASLKTADPKTANGNYSEYGELKRRITWNHAGALLHDVYWRNLGGDGDASKGAAIQAAIAKEFGSIETWAEDFAATAFAAKLSGWGVLVLDKLASGRLINVLVDEHMNGAIWGGIPLIACDVFEHAYYRKDGPARKTYIANFLKNLHWGRINEAYTAHAS
ncbi:MAG: superoxide dismutase [Planctomycetota bacterium]